MKTKNAILLIIILFLVNYPIISMLNVPKDPATATGLLQEKIKFKTGSGDDKEEILVVKFNQASATTKLEINLDSSLSSPLGSRSASVSTLVSSQSTLPFRT